MPPDSSDRTGHLRIELRADSIERMGSCLGSMLAAGRFRVRYETNETHGAGMAQNETEGIDQSDG